MATKNLLPDTFWVTFIELSSMSISNLVVFLTMNYVIWPNESYNKIFNKGIGPFHGFQCGQNYPDSGHWILISGQIAATFLYLLSLVFLIMDNYLQQNGILNKYKVVYPSPSNQRKISWKLYRESIYLAKINGAVAFLILPTVFVPLLEWRGNCDTLRFKFSTDPTLVNFLIMIMRMIITALASDVLFYIMHRLCHEVKLFYKYIHKIHHQFVETYAISATACHPLEHIFVNLATVLGAAVVSGLPLVPYFVYTSIASISTTFAHSGYGNPFRTIQVFNATPHDYHHRFQNCEYGNGANGFCDYLFGTRLQDVFPKRYKKLQKEYNIVSDNESSKRICKGLFFFDVNITVIINTLQAISFDKIIHTNERSE